jgi:lipocalin
MKPPRNGVLRRTIEYLGKRTTKGQSVTVDLGATCPAIHIILSTARRQKKTASPLPASRYRGTWRDNAENNVWLEVARHAQGIPS